MHFIPVQIKDVVCFVISFRFGFSFIIGCTKNNLNFCCVVYEIEFTADSFKLCDDSCIFMYIACCFVVDIFACFQISKSIKPFSYTAFKVFVFDFSFSCCSACFRNSYAIACIGQVFLIEAHLFIIFSENIESCLACCIAENTLKNTVAQIYISQIDVQYRFYNFAGGSITNFVPLLDKVHMSELDFVF